MTSLAQIEKRFRDGRNIFLIGYVPFRLLMAAKHRSIDEVIDFGLGVAVTCMAIGLILMTAALARRIGRLRRLRAERKAYEAQVDPGDGSRGLSRVKS